MAGTRDRRRRTGEAGRYRRAATTTAPIPPTTAISVHTVDSRARRHLTLALTPPPRGLLELAASMGVRVKQLTLAPLLAETIKRLHLGQSMAALFKVGVARGRLEANAVSSVFFWKAPRADGGAVVDARGRERRERTGVAVHSRRRVRRRLGARTSLIARIARGPSHDDVAPLVFASS